MEIRDAVPDDWSQIWPILRGIVAAGETFTWPRDIAEADARAIWMSGPPRRTFVAVEDGLVKGTAELHPNQMGPGAHVANAGFMVDPTATGRGVARALCAHVIEQARKDGYRAMQFNAVVETNTRAVELWLAYGFEILATVPEAFDHPTHGYVGFHVMWRSLV
jgi:L-amino acid N-acyltransferase YncA